MRRRRLPAYTEAQAIAAMKRVALRWPSTLGLVSMGGSLSVIKLDDNGGFVHLSHDGLDPDMVVADIKGIPNDGGDW